MIKFLIVDKMHDTLIPMLRKIGIETDYQPYITRNEIIDQLADCQGMVIRSKTLVDKQLLSKASKLKYICRAGAGIDNLDVDFIESQNIKIINAPEGNRNALAEHTMGLMFSMLNKIVKADREVRIGKWDREGNRGTEIINKTMGIIGFGHMGSSVANLLQHFGCRIMVYDKYKSGFTTDKIKQVDMNTLFNEVDIISFHIPLTDETRALVNSSYLKRFKKSIWLINTSRGEVVDQMSLIDGLENGTIKGCALDVLEDERINGLKGDQKEKFNYLTNSDRVILTPHVAGWSDESYIKINEVLVEKLQKEF